MIPRLPSDSPCWRLRRRLPAHATGEPTSSATPTRSRPGKEGRGRSFVSLFRWLRSVLCSFLPSFVPSSASFLHVLFSRPFVTGKGGQSSTPDIYELPHSSCPHVHPVQAIAPQLPHQPPSFPSSLAVCIAAWDMPPCGRCPAGVLRRAACSSCLGIVALHRMGALRPFGAIVCFSAQRARLFQAT